MACRRIARGVHGDVIVVEPGEHGHIRIDLVRDVIAAAGYRPFEGRRRVVIIDEADAMTADAQGALLKTLEEPPSASTLVLLSSAPDALLATIRSRCTRLRVGPLTPAEVAALLMREHEYGETEAHAAAAEADGSIGRALEARSTDLVAAREDACRLLEQAARSTDPMRRLDLAKDLTGRRKTTAEERMQLASCLRAVGALLRDLALLATRADRALLTNADLGQTLTGLTGTFDARRSERASRAVGKALDALAQNVNPKVVADWVVLQL
jgi:DNA polymerase-3 subunit delta'